MFNKAALGLLLLGCSQQLTIERNGTIDVIEVRNADILSKERVVEKATASNPLQGRQECTYSGVCFGCGVNVMNNSNVECFTGFHLSCDGSRNVLFRNIAYDVRYIYRLRIDGVEKDLQSPLYRETVTEILKAGHCQ